MDGLDVVSVGVQDKRSVVTAGVLGPQARGSIVASTSGERSCVERVDLLTSVSRERNMHRRFGPVFRRDREVSCVLEPELDLARVIAPRTDLSEAQRHERPGVEGAAAGKVTDANGEVIDYDTTPRHNPTLVLDPRAIR